MLQLWEPHIKYKLWSNIQKESIYDKQVTVEVEDLIAGTLHAKWAVKLCCTDQLLSLGQTER